MGTFCVGEPLLGVVIAEEAVGREAVVAVEAEDFALHV